MKICFFRDISYEILVTYLVEVKIILLNLLLVSWSNSNLDEHLDELVISFSIGEDSNEFFWIKFRPDSDVTKPQYIFSANSSLAL